MCTCASMWGSGTTGQKSTNNGCRINAELCAPEYGAGTYRAGKETSWAIDPTTGHQCRAARIGRTECDKDKKVGVAAAEAVVAEEDKAAEAADKAEAASTRTATTRAVADAT